MFPFRNYQMKRIVDWCLLISLADENNWDVVVYGGEVADFLDTLIFSKLEDMMSDIFDVFKLV